MGEPARSLLLLAGRLDAQGEIDSMRAFLDRLARLGVAANLLYVSAGEGTSADERFIECPRLSHRWQLALAVRRLRLGRSLAPARVAPYPPLHDEQRGAGDRRALGSSLHSDGR